MFAAFAVSLGTVALVILIIGAVRALDDQAPPGVAQRRHVDARALERLDRAREQRAQGDADPQAGDDSTSSSRAQSRESPVRRSVTR